MSVRGATLADLLVGSMLALLVLAGVLAGVAGGGRGLARMAARAIDDETVVVVTDALRFDVRQAGFDPRAAGIAAIVSASGDRLTLEADLDGDARIDGRSAERVRWLCRHDRGDLQRVVGRQRMPLAGDLAVCGFDYLDADGRRVARLDAAGRRRVRVVVLAIALARPRVPDTPQGTHRIAVAIRTPPGTPPGTPR